MRRIGPSFVWCAAGSSERDDDLAPGPAGLDVADGLRGLVEWVDAIDDRSKPAALDQLLEGKQVLAVRGREEGAQLSRPKTGSNESPEHAHDRPGPLAGTRGDHHKPSLVSQDPREAREPEGAADVEDQVVALPYAGHVLGGVVDDVVGAEGPDNLDGLGRGGGRDLGLERLGDLDGHRSDPAPCADDEDALPGTDAPLVAEPLERGESSRRHRGGLLERHVLWHRHHDLAGHVLGKRAGAGPEDAVAGPDVSDGRSDRLDDTGDVEAEALALRTPQALAQTRDIRLAAEHVPVMGVDR